MKGHAYYRLMRFDKPAGIILLWSPTAWALWLSHNGMPPLKLLLLFLLGTIIMRAAGCVMNDIADRKIDKHVRRTHKRPLAANEVNLTDALILLISLWLLALLIVLKLPPTCLYYAVIALLVTVIYPFCKRFIQAPQLVLGVAFSMGIPMVYSASSRFNYSMIFLLLINFAWIIAYDTQYAMIDKTDDKKIGVHSTAILFGNYDRVVILLLHLFIHALWLVLAWYDNFFVARFIVCWVFGGIVFSYQHYLLTTQEAQQYLRAFSSNALYGLLLWFGIVMAYIQ
jgi:4-hydroxybenzoate polyprenyltransferase